MNEQDIHEHDAQLATHIAKTLDASLDELDELSVRRLEQARNSALATQAQSAIHWGRWVVAAGVMLVVALPLGWHVYNVQQEQDIEMVSQDIPPTADELDDMDMLIVLGMLMPKWCIGLLLLAVPVFAADPPPQEFWEYMSDFSDDNGNVVDPLEFDQVVGKESEVSAEKTAQVQNTAPVKSGAKLPEEHTSSASAASTSVKARGDN